MDFFLQGRIIKSCWGGAGRHLKDMGLNCCNPSLIFQKKFGAPSNISECVLSPLLQVQVLKVAMSLCCHNFTCMKMSVLTAKHMKENIISNIMKENIVSNMMRKWKAVPFKNYFKMDSCYK